MRFKIFIIVLFGILVVSCSNKTSLKKTTNDWSRQNLKGKVKSLTLYWYNNIDSLGQITKNSEKYVLHYFLFDKNGYVIKDVTNFDMTGRQYEYDTKGNLIVETTYDNNFMMMLYKMTYNYDNNGKLIGGALFAKTGGTPENTYNYKYDLNGILIEEDCFDDKGRLSHKNKYKNDTKGNQIEDIKFDSDSVSVFKNIYKYDSIDEKIEYYQYDSKDSLVIKEIYIYDRDKNILEEKNYNVYNSPDKRNLYHIYKYDFDKTGNWIKRIDYINNIPKYIKVRELEYY
jgi:hypothetical protein